MGPSSAWDGFVVGSGSVWVWTDFVPCLGWVILGQDGPRTDVSLGWVGLSWVHDGCGMVLCCV